MALAEYESALHSIANTYLLLFKAVKGLNLNQRTNFQA